MSARILNVTDAEYRSDPCLLPSLTQSIAKTLLTKSPAHAYSEHPRLGNRRKASTADMDHGTLIHRLLLGEGPTIQVIEFDDYRKKAAQEARDEAISNGAIPVKRVQYEAASQAAALIRARIQMLGIDLNGASEVAIEWDEDGVLCRCKLDHVFLESGRIIDIKKAESAHPKAIQRAMVNYSYDLQAAAYPRAVEALKPDLAGRTDMLFLFCEVEPPYAVTPARLNGAFRAYGESRWLRAVNTWRICMERNEWPAYSAVDVELPGWLMGEEIVSE